MVRSVPASLPERLGLAALRAGRLSRPTAKLASATPKRRRVLGYSVVAMRDIRLTELPGIHVLVIDNHRLGRHFPLARQEPGTLNLKDTIVTENTPDDIVP